MSITMAHLVSMTNEKVAMPISTSNTHPESESGQDAYPVFCCYEILECHRDPSIISMLKYFFLKRMRYIIMIFQKVQFTINFKLQNAQEAAPEGS